LINAGRKLVFVRASSAENRDYNEKKRVRLSLFLPDIPSPMKNPAAARPREMSKAGRISNERSEVTN
jgi:hypothetical protein